MTDLLAAWIALDPTAQTAIMGALAGLLLWGVQRYWTACPWLPLLGPDSSTQKKRLAALLFACVPGVILGAKTGNWQQALAVTIPALLASQAAKLAEVKAEETPCPPSKAKEGQRGLYDDDAADYDQ